MRKVVFVLFLTFFPLSIFAQKHEIRFMISDPMWETAAFHNRSTQTNYSYTPHFGLEYMYSVNDWFSAGAVVDIQSTSWKQDSMRKNFYNLCILPTARFTYFRRGLVDIHSGVSLGMDINGGTEEFYKGGNTVAAFALDLNYVGVSVGKGHWWGTFDLGGTFALYDKTQIYLLSARIFRLGVAYRF